MKRKLIMKCSKLLVMVLLMSVLLPSVAFASSIISFNYYEDYDVLTGYIYTKDPGSVSVQVDISGTVTEITYDTHRANWSYDDNNNAYSSLEFRDEFAQTPDSINVIETGVTQSVPVISIMDKNMYFRSDSTVTLDVYRMEAEEYLSAKAPNTFLQPGDELVRFTPVDDNVDAVKFVFPHTVTEVTYLDNDAFEISDFEIYDLTGDSVVTSFKGMSMVISNMNGVIMGVSIELILQENFIAGHEYSLVLSAQAAGDEIKLPGDGIYNASVEVGESYIDPDDDSGSKAPWDGVYKRNIKYFRDLVIGTPPEEDETPPLDNDDNADPGNNNGSGNNPPINKNKDKQIVNENSLKNGKDGKVAVEIANGKKQVLLPANAAEMVGKNKLELGNDEFTAEIPSEVLAELQALVSEEDLADSNISFKFTKVSDTDAEQLLEQSNGNKKAKITAAGEVFEFTLSIIDKDGKETELSEFSEPIVLKLKVNEIANQDLLGVYYISDDGVLEYVGGEIIDGEMVASINHFSKYAVLEYDKTFTDVAAEYWAAEVIKVMASKHVITGINGEEYAPEENMTRAELAALLVRALGLESSATTNFTDVAADSWYAGVVASANEAGLIDGRSETIFAPNEYITREEMAAMLVRSYELKSGTDLSTDTVAAFADRDAASNWALPYIDAASSAGIVQGRSNNTFAPQELMTRAEGAQIVYTLLMN